MNETEISRVNLHFPSEVRDMMIKMAGSKRGLSAWVEQLVRREWEKTGSNKVLEFNRNGIVFRVFIDPEERDDVERG